ncbi:MAG: PAS domain-containing protein [Planctomycetota bacterium]
MVASHVLAPLALVPDPVSLALGAAAAAVGLGAALLLRRTRGGAARRVEVASGPTADELFDRMEQPVCRFDPDTTLRYVNEAYCRLWGRSADELLGRRWVDFCDETVRPGVAAHLATITDENPATCEECRVVNADGVTWMLWNQLGVADAEGRIEQIYALGTDLTERRRLEDQVRSSRERLAVALDEVGFGHFEIDFVTGRVERSGRWHELLGIQPTDMEPTVEAWIERLHPDDVDRVLAKTDAHVTGTTPSWCVEYRIRHANGSWVWVEDRGRVVERDANGAPTRAIGIAQDIRTRRAAADELEKARESAERASVAKGRFLANVSHEIRTPLTAIIGYAELARDVVVDLEDDELSHDLSECLQTVLRNGRHLQSLIEDVLDVSKIEAGAIEPVFEKADPEVVVREAVGMLAVRADARGIGLEYDVARSVPRSVRTDALRVRQIVVNLVGNAVKFTEHGRVRVELRTATGSSRRLSQGVPGELHVVVSDDGPGIDADTLAKLFQPFQQGDASTTRRFGGTGLGLAISQSFAQMLGGRVFAQSYPGEGSVFTLALPLDPAELSDPREAPAAALPRVHPRTEHRAIEGRILLAEDGADNRRLVSLVLERAGLEVECAANGREAVDDFLAAREEGRPFDLVLMDVSMPVLDGYSATRELRAAGVGTPILALTANALEDERERAKEAGCDEHCTKPIHRETLLAAVEHWISVGRRRASLR